ncbi:MULTISPECIES: HAD-IIB family hydrolase [unclassified Breznakia]|uniref:HAD family hydrolase n=1 Tax=unclassified Breznakia TaxID=2623764 RepID=UPI002473E085|nr:MULTISPECIES: HAD-IIB family hydrolase [unclassified Breznakia]MDH6366214.1 Cof subfamily protein (haloacid dehalogenase superfamily) [Breznakia sp. PH1-1]MDH6403307.1 Cof subfamily protein (haloacid dehalogenase superfamily) [Breznakia sp. PF1-11]MDH6411016.1 Cof subfamily protein (haloacid dehalogenase superfamily) [Breznakia sp. PFB1-11]MDH6413380.1 Cof subfamily protein (haloacid dehalogenase superfamily) [Breznakia sp. PFB1-14]MDH6416145.1 Cof subfamily protein (haloacid dehalogenase s
MKVLASDVDGTLISEKGIIHKKTITAIGEWIDAGHVFVFVTGRDILTLRKDIEKHKIPFHFAICNNGSVIYNNAYEVIHEVSFSGELAKMIISDPIVRSSSYYILSAGFDRILVNSDIEVAKTYNYFTKEMGIEKVEAYTYYGIDMRFDSHDKVVKSAKLLQQNYGSQVSINPNIETLDINGKDSNKATALQWLVSNHLPPVEDVLVVGDGGNDMQMIATYQGYAMDNASDEVKAVASKVVTDVSEIVKQHLDKRAKPILNMHWKVLLYLVGLGILLYNFPLYVSYFYISLFFFKQSYNRYRDRYKDPLYKNKVIQNITLGLLWIVLVFISVFL